LQRGQRLSPLSFSPPSMRANFSRRETWRGNPCRANPKPHNPSF
jgi:hypothetical protein